MYSYSDEEDSIINQNMPSWKELKKSGSSLIDNQFQKWFGLKYLQSQSMKCIHYVHYHVFKKFYVSIKWILLWICIWFMIF